MNLTEICDHCVCPECLGRLEAAPLRGTLEALVCDRCVTLYPVEDGIPILLPQAARNYDLEGPLVERIGELLAPELSSRYRPHLDATVSALDRSRGKRTWEWEDEEFWSATYGKELHTLEQKDWNDRLRERRPLSDAIVKALGSFEGRTIVDVGAGEGQTFQHLMLPECTASTLYIAADISLNALRLNRLRNTHENALYVLCTASSLPFPARSVDVLSYWGILHHTQGRASTIASDSALVREGGFIVMHEAVSRPTFAATFRPHAAHDHSAHEERIDRSELVDTIAGLKGVEMVYFRDFHTPLYTLIMRGRLGSLVSARDSTFHLVQFADSLLMRTLGKVIPFFGPAAVLALLRCSVSPTAVTAPT